ncbi:MAG: hypothetical protein II997_09445 [Clostridia bacterium]|nr:hypothetical protein [Clostridia bacterium]
MHEKLEIAYQNAMKFIEDLYDSEFHAMRQLVTRTDNKGQKVTVWFHQTRHSFAYANLLLKHGQTEEAIKIIEKNLLLQEKDKNHPYYGLWPYFHEEPLDKMKVVDENWAAFCSNHLLQSVIRYGEKLPESLHTKIKEAIRAALVSIEKRDITPAYTNVSVLDFTVTLIAGEYYEWCHAIEYGKEKLIEACDYLKKTGGFSEYNSSNYIKVVLDELDLLYGFTKIEEIKPYILEMLDYGWKTVAEHYHKKTNQFCAPQARSYTTILKKSRAGWLKIASGRENDLHENDWLTLLHVDGTLDSTCPEKYLEYFKKPRTAMHREVFCKGTNWLPKQEASWYITPDYCIGSFSMSDLWSQRRALTAYWGTEQDIRYLNVRMLLNGEDFASGLIHTVQEENALMGIANFMYNGGNTHIVLDRIDGKIHVKDLRFRFEIQTNNAELKENEGCYTYNDEYLSLSLNLLKGMFDGKNAETKVTKADDKICIDVIFYSGDKVLDLRTIEETFCAFSLHIGEGEAFKNTNVMVDNDHVNLSGAWKGKQHTLSVSSRPCSKEQIGIMY